MKVTIEIDENLLNEAVMNVLVQNISAEIEKKWGEGYRFRTDAKAVMREVIRENMDVFADRAIAAAAKSIENRAIKKNLDALMQAAK